MDIPFRLDLEQQKKRAKELLNSFRQQQADAISRFHRSHPKLIYNEQTVTKMQVKLADAQLVIARELGCLTWKQLKEHITLMAILRNELHENGSVPDEPNHCLHIRCGNDIELTITEAGFNGDFLEFSDPLCVGPVSYDYRVTERAQFLQNSYGEALQNSEENNRSKLDDAFRSLVNSTKQYNDIVLWFEHDPYDQFILIFLLSYYHRFGRPKKLWHVTTNNFPGAAAFRGLGQLPPEGLRLLWRRRELISAQQCQEADQHWAAYTNPDRFVFHHHIKGLQHSSLPFFKEAALRQLQEQPIKQNQMPLTRQLTMDMLKETSPMSAGELFRKLMTKKEPIPFLGDLMYWRILMDMKNDGLIEFTEIHEHWPKTLIRPV